MGSIRAEVAHLFHTVNDLVAIVIRFDEDLARAININVSPQHRDPAVYSLVERLLKLFSLIQLY